jgi:hypothetical protein
MMRLVTETIGMLKQGITLSARRGTAIRGCPVALSPYINTVKRRCVNGQFVYEITDRSNNSGDETHTYKDVETAALIFAELVGWIGLDKAVSEYRYQWLFPRGSTLDWQTTKSKRRAA